MIQPDRFARGFLQAHFVFTGGEAIHVPLLNKFRAGERR
jgi:hypothetical protein